MMLRRKVWSLGVDFISGNDQLFGHSMVNSSKSGASPSSVMMNRSGMIFQSSNERRAGNGNRSPEPTKRLTLTLSYEGRVPIRTEL